MSKPEEIVALEKQYDIVISAYSNSILNNKNYFLLDDNDDIISLSLVNNQISDISFLVNFPFLKSLNLSHNEISDISIIESLYNLETLNLSDNNISNIFYLENLNNLKTLLLNENHIFDASCISNLSSLNVLSLSHNQIYYLGFLDYLYELTDLNLSSNEISDISFLENLMSLKNLNLNNNEISNISVFEFLTEISYLDLSSNQISDTSYLEKLTELTTLCLNTNEISNIDLRSLSKLKKLFLRNNHISDISSLAELINLEQLDVCDNKIVDIAPLRNLKNIKILNLSINLISNISVLSKLKQVSELYLNQNINISDISILEGLNGLLYLNLSNNDKIKDFSIIGNLRMIRALFLNNLNIRDFSFLKKLINIRILFLAGNGITEISFLKNMSSINTLYLSSNKISNIDVIKELRDITSLYLQKNTISDISILKELTSIKILDLSDNMIVEIEQFEFISNLPSLFIIASNNPCFHSNRIMLDENNNNYDTILNSIIKINESKRMYHLPAKVLFLGNTESGKSTLLDYILQNKELREIKKNLDSTHIVQIATLPKKLKRNEIPKAVFYDFGGQDYYHGLYKAFLSNDSINIILWNKDYDKNQIRKDRNAQLTRDYNRNYWLNQLKFQYTKENNKKLSELDKTEPILLVQTHADKENHIRETYKGDCEVFNIKNEFFVSLNQASVENSVIEKINLSYLEETLNDLIQQKQIIKKEPFWYKSFLNYILRTSTESFTLLSDVVLKYKRKNDPDNLLLPEVLRELAQTGLVLYYKDDVDLKDIVWLDPSKTIQHIHNSILSKSNIIEKKGIVERSVLEEFADQKIVKLLLNQKVIFFDEFDDQYIIPGYLCLTEEDDRIYELLTFDFIEPNFIMKFEYFIPFGLINQLVCHYGKNRHKKYYWRDQLLFTKDNCKILIKLDFNNLEISVSIKSKKNNSRLNKLEQEIFTDILNLYWDKIPFEVKRNDLKIDNIKIDDINIENLIEGKLKASVSHDDIKVENLVQDQSRDNVSQHYSNSLVSPDDLYISIDNKFFVSHKDLQNEDKTFSKIISFGLEIKKEIQNDREIEIRKLNKNLVVEKSAGLFKNFANNKNTEKMKKIFISYSKFDDDYKKEFVKHLITLKDENLVDPFNCDEIDLGDDSHEVIQRKLAECDYMVALVSVDLLNTKYIRDFEVDKAEELGKKIIPIIIKPCDWETSKLGKHHASLRGTNISLDKKLYLDGDIKEVSKIERAAFWTAVIKEFRAKLF